MPTRYLDIADLQPPYDLGILDGNSRSVWVFNIMAYKEPSATFLLEIVKVLTTAAVGTFGTNIFISSKAVIPSGAGPYLNIVSTGGVAGVRTHNVTTGPTYERPTAQLTARAASSAAAEAMARAAYAALVGVRNAVITP